MHNKTDQALTKPRFQIHPVGTLVSYVFLVPTRSIRTIRGYSFSGIRSSAIIYGLLKYHTDKKDWSGFWFLDAVEKGLAQCAVNVTEYTKIVVGPFVVLGSEGEQKKRIVLMSFEGLLYVMKPSAHIGDDSKVHNNQLSTIVHA